MSSQLVQITRHAMPVAPAGANGARPTGGPPLSLEELRDQVGEGLMYAHSRANANTTKVLEVASFSYALIELLMERGLVSVEELDERKREVGQRLVEKFVENGMGVALTADEEDKYAYQSDVKIDCENRLQFCRGACCRLRFALTTQDLEEGRVKWDLGRPYLIRQDADGYCHHVERTSHRCTVYENRPIVCRAYDCRNDKRIWADFENMVVSPDLEKLFRRPEELAAEQEAAEAAAAASPETAGVTAGTTEVTAEVLAQATAEPATVCEPATM